MKKQSPKRGRPFKLDDRKVRALRGRGRWSVVAIAEKFGVTRDAVYRSLRRTQR